MGRWRGGPCELKKYTMFDIIGKIRLKCHALKNLI